MKNIAKNPLLNVRADTSFTQRSRFFNEISYRGGAGRRNLAPPLSIWLRFLWVHVSLICCRLYAIDSVLRQFIDCGSIDNADQRPLSRSREIALTLAWVDCPSFDSRITRRYPRRALDTNANGDWRETNWLCSLAAIAISAPGASCLPGNREPTESEVGTIGYTSERDESEKTIDICCRATCWCIIKHTYRIVHSRV